MIVLFTDFGLVGPYTGQMLASLQENAPAVPVISLFADAPSHDPKAAAYLLAAYYAAFPADSVYLCVVDPGVGGTRKPLVVEADGRWFVGPDNGLFELIVRRSGQARVWTIIWQPEVLSATFHGRDLFAPVAAKLATGGVPPGDQVPTDDIRRQNWPDDLSEIVYIDHYGNAMTGIRANQLNPQIDLNIGDDHLKHADTFSHVSSGELFWYENANGLVEIAVSGGSAAEKLGLAVGTLVGLNV